MLTWAPHPHLPPLCRDLTWENRFHLSVSAGLSSADRLRLGLGIWRALTWDIVFYPVVASSCRPPVPFFCYILPLFLACRLFCWQDKIKLRVLMVASVSLQPPPSSPPAGASAIRLREHLKDASRDWFFLDLKLLRPALSQCCSLQIKCHITEFVIPDGCSLPHFQQRWNQALLFKCSHSVVLKPFLHLQAVIPQSYFWSPAISSVKHRDTPADAANAEKIKMYI